jgi:isocitrate dehydrogenase
LHHAKLDSNDALRDFCIDLEAARVKVINKDSVMTKDLALAIHGKDKKWEHWVVMNVYLDAVNVSRVSTLFCVKNPDGCWRNRIS